MDTQYQMAKQLSKVTNMRLMYAMQLLEITDYCYETAMEVFRKMKTEGDIPTEGWAPVLIEIDCD